MYEPVPRIRPIPFPGFPAPFWFRHMKRVGSMIEQYKLKPLGPLERKMFPFPDAGTAGGNRGPHFHFGDDIYVVQPKQWQEFSSGVVTELRKALEEAQTVSPTIEELQDLDHVVSGFQR